MNNETSIEYVVYDLLTYFSRQPGDLSCCPDCGGPLSISNLQPSRAVANDLEHDSLIPVHCFSRLYRCHDCQWAGVRESWAFCECNSMCDYLIVIAGERSLGRTDRQTLLLREVLENEHVYDSAMPFPDTLGQLFAGGKRQKQYLPVLNPGERIRLVADVTLHQPTYYGPMYSLGTKGSQGTLMSYAEYQATYEQQTKAGQIHLEDSKKFEAIWVAGARREIDGRISYAIRLETLEPASPDRIQGRTLGTVGELYLVEVSNVEKCIDESRA